MPQIYRISKFPYYDSRQQRAYSAYKIDRQPTGALSQYVRTVEKAKNRIDAADSSCIIGIKNPEGATDMYEFIRHETLPVLLSWLTENSYTILPSMSDVLLCDSHFMIQAP